MFDLTEQETTHDSPESSEAEMVDLTEQGTTHDSPEAEMIKLTTEEGTAPDSSYSSAHNSSNETEMVDLTMDNTSEPETPSEPTVTVTNTPSTGSEEQLTSSGRSVPECSVTFAPSTSSRGTSPSNSSGGTSEPEHSATATLQPSVKYSSTQILSYTSPDANVTMETRSSAKGDSSVESENQCLVTITTHLALFVCLQIMVVLQSKDHWQGPVQVKIQGDMMQDH